MELFVELVDGYMYFLKTYYNTLKGFMTTLESEVLPFYPRFHFCFLIKNLSNL